VANSNTSRYRSNQLQRIAASELEIAGRRYT